MAPPGTACLDNPHDKSILPYLPPISSDINNRRKRRPAGTPDPDAEVVSLSPKTLMESDRYVCEICKQGFQRDQNLQMHRRRHKVPWKLLKRDTPQVRKRVFVCPEPTCLHHHPSHALGDLVGIKKHFRRKHSSCKRWTCERCSKAYAVHSDYKAHLKTCGTRGHTCDCGRVFSRVESFIEHQDTCDSTKEKGALRLSDEQQSLLPSQYAPSLSAQPFYGPPTGGFISSCFRSFVENNRELQLMPFAHQTSLTVKNSIETAHTASPSEKISLVLQLSIGVSGNDKNDPLPKNHSSDNARNAMKKSENETEQWNVASADMANAQQMRKMAKTQLALAQTEFCRAKTLREYAEEELQRAQFLRDKARMEIDQAQLILSCRSCSRKFQWPCQSNSSFLSNFQEGAGENEYRIDFPGKNSAIPKITEELGFALPLLAPLQSSCSNDTSI